MRDDVQAVLKSAKNYQNQTLWEAFYINGEKVLENFFLDENALLKAFKLDNVKIIKLPIYEKDVDNYLRYFPDSENFSHLFDTVISPLRVNQKVYIDEYLDDEFIIEGGWVIVKDIYTHPNTNLIWERNAVVEEKQIWFSCLEFPGVFYWNRLHLMQDDLNNRFKDTAASLKERKPD